MREAIDQASTKIDSFIGQIRVDSSAPSPIVKNIISIELEKHLPKSKTPEEIFVRAARKILSKCDEGEHRGYSCDCYCHTGDWPFEGDPHCTCLCGEADSLRLAFKEYDDVGKISSSS